jgi:hypothetical protein
MVDFLVVVTERLQLMVLKYDAATKTLKNVATGDLRVR